MKSNNILLCKSENSIKPRTKTEFIRTAPPTTPNRKGILDRIKKLEHSFSRIGKGGNRTHRSANPWKKLTFLNSKTGLFLNTMKARTVIL